MKSDWFNLALKKSNTKNTLNLNIIREGKKKNERTHNLASSTWTAPLIMFQPCLTSNLKT